MSTKQKLASAKIPVRFDLRTQLPSIRDQGERGTCVAFAVTALHEVAQKLHNHLSLDLSEEALYWSCKRIDGNHDSGTSLLSSTLALASPGQPPENTWPYDGSRDDTNSQYLPPGGNLDPNTCRRASLVPMRFSKSRIKRELASGHAIVAGIILSRGFVTTQTGWIPMPTSNKELIGGHAIAIVGYDTTVSQGELTLIFRNSWGEEWGDSGYGYLPSAYLAQYGAGLAIVASLLP